MARRRRSPNYLHARDETSFSLAGSSADFVVLGVQGLGSESDSKEIERLVQSTERRPDVIMVNGLILVLKEKHCVEP